MAKSVGKFGKKAQDSLMGRGFANILNEGKVTSRESLGYELDFIESPTGLGITLYGAQSVMVKAAFGIPLDYKEKMVPVWDTMKTTLLHTFTETDFVKWLFDQGRCNIEDWRDIPPKGFGTMVLYAGRRGGKMLGVDERIPTPHGFKRNGDLVENDRVFGEDGKSYRVVHAHPIEEVEAFKVSFDDGTSTYAHAGHLWHTCTHFERRNIRRRKPAPAVIPLGLCGCGCGQPAPLYTRTYGSHRAGTPYRFIKFHHHRAKRTKEVIGGGTRTTAEILATLKAPTKKGESNHAIPLSAPLDLGGKTLPIDPYCLGVWLGDGNADCGMVTAEEEDAQSLRPHFEAAGFAFTKMASGRQRWSVKGLHKPLRLLGVLDNKHIPSDYLWSSTEQRLALLQGLMDSDGTCDADGGVEFTNTNEQLARGVYHLAATLGLKPHWSEGVATLNGRDCGPKYRVRWTAPLRVFRLPRKVSRLPKTTRPWTQWRYITSVEPAGRMHMRCITTDNPTHLYLFGENCNVTHNSQVVSAIGSSLLRNLLAIHSPQQYYDLVKGSELSFTLMGTDEDSSTRLYKKLRDDVNGCNYFSPYIRDNNELEMKFVTEADRNNRDVLPSISVKSFVCSTRSARGPSNYFLALDEFQFFRASKDTNSTELYKAATPSTSQFAPPDDEDTPDSKIVVISSPATRLGKMYELHDLALTEGADSGIFTMRLSTVEMNPRIPRKRLLQDLKENPDTFKAEFGGEFLDGSGSYVPEVQFDTCVDLDRENQTRFSLSTVGRKYFWGFDLGMKNDATALAIGHLEMVEGFGIQLIYDYIDRMMVGERFTGPGVELVEEQQKYIGVAELDVVDIISWLFYMHQVLPCFRGMTDQHAGSHFKQLLQLNGITAMELKHLTDQINSQMFFALRGFISHSAARFPNVPKFIKEFKSLEASYRNKYTLAVAAPGEKGSHDDMGDACALVALQAQEWLDTDGKLDLDPSGRTMMVNPNLLPPVPILDVNGVSVRDLQIEGRIRMMENRPLISAKQLSRGGYGGGGRRR